MFATQKARIPAWMVRCVPEARLGSLRGDRSRCNGLVRPTAAACSEQPARQPWQYLPATELAHDKHGRAERLREDPRGALSRSLRANTGTRRPILTAEKKVGTRPTPRPKDWLRERPESEDRQGPTEYRDPRSERQDGVPSDEHVSLAEWLRGSELGPGGRGFESARCFLFWL